MRVVTHICSDESSQSSILFDEMGYFVLFGGNNAKLYAARLVSVQLAAEVEAWASGVSLQGA